MVYTRTRSPAEMTWEGKMKLGVPSATSCSRHPVKSTAALPRLAIWTYSSASLRGTKPSKKMHSITTVPTGWGGTGVAVGKGVRVGTGVGVAVGRGVDVGVAVAIGDVVAVGAGVGVAVGKAIDVGDGVLVAGGAGTGA